MKNGATFPDMMGFLSRGPGFAGLFLFLNMCSPRALEESFAIALLGLDSTFTESRWLQGVHFDSGFLITLFLSRPVFLEAPNPCMPRLPFC